MPGSVAISPCRSRDVRWKSHCCIAVSCAIDSASCIETSTSWPSPVRSLWKTASSAPCAADSDAVMQAWLAPSICGAPAGSPDSVSTPEAACAMSSVACQPACGPSRPKPLIDT